jgi:hypothetical protein
VLKRVIQGGARCAGVHCGGGGGDNMRTDPSKPRGEGLAPATNPKQSTKVGLPPITPD